MPYDRQMTTSSNNQNDVARCGFALPAAAHAARATSNSSFCLTTSRSKVVRPGPRPQQPGFHHRHRHCYLHDRDSGTMTDVGITTTSVAHVRLTVTDIERSRQFYESVFGWPVLIEIPDDADEATRNQLAFLHGGVVYDLGGTLIGLRPVADDRFDENRVGLDRIAFRAEVVRHLRERAQNDSGCGVSAHKHARSRQGRQGRQGKGGKHNGHRVQPHHRRRT